MNPVTNCQGFKCTNPKSKLETKIDFVGEYLFNNPSKIIPLNMNSSKTGAAMTIKMKVKTLLWLTRPMSAFLKLSGIGIKLVIGPTTPISNAIAAIIMNGIIRLFLMAKLNE